MRKLSLALIAAAALGCSESTTSTLPPAGGSIVVSGRLLAPGGEPAWGTWGTAYARLISDRRELGRYEIRPDLEGRFSITIGPFEAHRSVNVDLEFHSPGSGGVCQRYQGTTLDLGPLLLSERPQPLIRDVMLPANGKRRGRLVPGTVCAWGTSLDTWMGVTLQIESVTDSVRGYWLMDHPSAIATQGTLRGAVTDGVLVLELEQSGRTPPWCDGGWRMRMPVGPGDTLGTADSEPTGVCSAYPMRFEFVVDAYWDPLPW